MKKITIVITLTLTLFSVMSLKAQENNKTVETVNKGETRFNYHLKEWDEKTNIVLSEREQQNGEIMVHIANGSLRNPSEALVEWKKLYSKYPSLNKRVYIVGARIYRLLIKDEKDIKKKDSLVDELMVVYDNRIKYLGNQGFVLGLMGNDIYRIYGKDIALDTYELTKKSIELEKEKSNNYTLFYFVKAAIDLYNLSEINETELKNAYNLSIKNSNSSLNECIDIRNKITSRYSYKIYNDMKEYKSNLKKMEYIKKNINKIEEIYNQLDFE